MLELNLNTVLLFYFVLKNDIYQILNILILITIFFFSIIYSNDYIWPNNYEGQITTTFCEPRFRRFHAGIDIRTEGKIGSDIYAIASGYIYRIKIDPDNYGKAIYLKLNDGNMVLYSHLSNFNVQAEELIKNLYLKYNSSFFDHVLNKDEIISLNIGDIIGYSGDSGSVGGPHIHFEIRTEDNEPINPLTNYYYIPDTIPPIAKTISFIPLNEDSWINDIQDYQTFNLEKIGFNKYELIDTIKVLGKFGIAIETYDIIDNLPFNFGVYNIDFLIDKEIIYSIKFDKYQFTENPLIYTEIDYHLLQKDIIAHRLFNKKNHQLSFIKLNKSDSLILNNKYHDFLINISDATNNITQVRGTIVTDTSIHNNLNLDAISTDSIKGEINIKHLDNGIIIEFSEYISSGLLPKLELSSKNNNHEYKLYRKEKNLISSGLININSLDKISIIYNTSPKTIFEREVSVFSPELNNQFTLSNGIILSNVNKDSFYNHIMFWIDEKIELPINEEFDVIVNPMIINPIDIAFKKKLKLDYKSDDNNNYAFYKYNEKDKSWKYSETTSTDDKITTKISSGGIFCILTEKNGPLVYDIFPEIEQTYMKKEVKNISFHIEDELSGINPYKIKIIINGKKLFYDYIKYRKFVTANLEGYLSIGKNEIDIYIYDYLDNLNNIRGEFFILE